MKIYVAALIIYLFAGSSESTFCVPGLGLNYYKREFARKTAKDIANGFDTVAERSHYLKLVRDVDYPFNIVSSRILIERDEESETAFLRDKRVAPTDTKRLRQLKRYYEDTRNDYFKLMKRLKSAERTWDRELRRLENKAELRKEYERKTRYYDSVRKRREAAEVKWAEAAKILPVVERLVKFAEYSKKCD